MNESIEEWQNHFSSLSIDDLISHVVKQFPRSIVELTALYGRFISIAFIDATKSNHVRVLAASWAKAIESVVEVGFADGSAGFEAFCAYCNSSKILALEHGYGTPMYRVRHDGKQVFEILDGKPEHASVTATATLLALVAFGPHPND